MAKESKQKIRKELESDSYYRWEFLRRNEDYKHDYKQLEDVMKQLDQLWKSKEPIYPNNPLKIKLSSEFDKLGCQMKNKYQVRQLIDPKKDFSEIGHTDPRFGPVRFSPEKNPVLIVRKFSDLNRLLREKGWFTDTKGRKEKLEYICALYLWQNRYLNLGIDTDRGIEEIMKAVKAEILWAKKLKEDVGIATNKDRQKQGSELYARYLKIWDLRAKHISWRFISNTVYPDEAQAASSDEKLKRLIDRVKKQYVAAHEIIYLGQKPPGKDTTEYLRERLYMSEEERQAKEVAPEPDLAFQIDVKEARMGMSEQQKAIFDLFQQGFNADEPDRIAIELNIEKKDVEEQVKAIKEIMRPIIREAE